LNFVVIVSIALRINILKGSSIVEFHANTLCILLTDDAPDENKETETQDAEDDNQMSGQDFKWGAVIREVLENQPNHEIQMKKLQKKVFAQYYAVVGDSKGAKTKEELISKLNKKLKKSQFKIFKENVKLVE